MADEWYIVAGFSTTSLILPIEEFEQRRRGLEMAHENFMLIWNRIITRGDNLQMRSLVAGFSGFVVDMQRQLDALPTEIMFLRRDAAHQYVNRRFGREERRLRAEQAAFAETLVQARGVLRRFWVGMRRYEKDGEVVMHPDAVRPVTYRNRYQMETIGQGHYWDSFQAAMAACGIAEDEEDVALANGMAALGIAEHDGRAGRAAGRTDACLDVRDTLREMRACLRTRTE
jgi:hypothetical protein